jgi:hypothetical protein
MDFRSRRYEVADMDELRRKEKKQAELDRKVFAVAFMPKGYLWVEGCELLED